MTAHSYRDGLRVPTLWHSRYNSVWTDDDCQGYFWSQPENRWVPFQLIQDLLPVTNLVVQGGYPTDHQVAVQWVNPTPATFATTPNETWVRIPQLTEIWSVLPYPITTWDWAVLAASTPYTVQVRLARRINLTLHVSPITSVDFTTTANVAQPLITIPKPGDNTSSEVPLPPITAGTCTYEWTLWLAQPDVGWSVVQTGSLAGTGSPAALDFPSLIPGGVYKLCYHTLCSGVPGTEVCGLPWMEPTDWSSPCVPNDTGLAAFAASSPTFIMAQTCAPQQRKIYSTGEVVWPGPLWGGLMDGPYGSGSFSVIAPATIRVDLMESATVAADVAGVDTQWSMARWVYLTSELDPVIGDCAIFGLNNRRFLGLRARSGHTVPIAVAISDNGDVHTLEGPSPLALNAWHLLVATYQNNGGLPAVKGFKLYVDGSTLVASMGVWS